MFIPGVNIIALGFISGYISTGTLKGALIGAFSAGFGGGSILRQAMIGGITSVASGGKFWRGFASAGLTAGIGGAFGGKINNMKFPARVITKMIIRGTISQITGGKFANGARSAAMNEIASEVQASGRKPTKEEVTYAELADGVYDADFNGTNGYEREKSFLNDETGFKAALFVNKDTGHRVLAFAGTDGTSLDDWAQNLIQGVGGGSQQYKQAIETAELYHQKYGGNIHFTGHSLGGGLASAAAIVTGGSATVFNAAAVHPNTIGDYSYSRGKVTHFYSSDDALTFVNTFLPGRVPGEQVNLGKAGFHDMVSVCKKMGCYQ